MVIKLWVSSRSNNWHPGRRTSSSQQLCAGVHTDNWSWVQRPQCSISSWLQTRSRASDASSGMRVPVDIYLWVSLHSGSESVVEIFVWACRYFSQTLQTLRENSWVWIYHLWYNPLMQFCSLYRGEGTQKAYSSHKEGILFFLFNQIYICVYLYVYLYCMYICILYVHKYTWYAHICLNIYV